MPGELLGKRCKDSDRLGRLVEFDQAHPEGIEHLGQPLGLRVLAAEALPDGDGLLPLACLPGCLAQQVGGTVGFGMFWMLREELPQAVGRSRKGRWLAGCLGGAEASAGKLPAGSGQSVGVGGAASHLGQGLLRCLPVARLQLADTEVIAGFGHQRIVGMVGNQALPFFGGKIPGLAVLQRCR